MALDATLTMRDATIMFRNFAGKEGMYNAEGQRNFCVALDAETAQKMRDDGWKVKQLRVREPGDEPQDYIQVSVKYQGRNGKVKPPVVALITSQGRTNLDEDTIEILDYMDIEKIDLIIRPYEWSVNGNSGVKAYLTTIFFFALEDELQLEYSDIPMVGETRAIESGGGEEIWEGEVVSDVEDGSQLAIGR